MVLPLSRRVQWLANRCRRRGRGGERGRAAAASTASIRRDCTSFACPGAIRPGNDCLGRRAAAARRALGLPSDGRLVGFFGGLQRREGPSRRVGSVAARPRESPGGVHLFVCGPSDVAADRQRFESARRAARPCTAGSICSAGPSTFAQPAMTAADVVILPTRAQIGEALPLVLLEAMACGDPGHRHARRRGTRGDRGGRRSRPPRRPDDPKDLGRVLGEVLADRRSAAAMADRALGRLRNEFDPARAADRYDDLFRKLSRETF